MCTLNIDEGRMTEPEMSSSPALSHSYEQDFCSGTLIYSVDNCEPLCLSFSASIRIQIVLDSDKKFTGCDLQDEKIGDGSGLNNATDDYIKVKDLGLLKGGKNSDSSRPLKKQTYFASETSAESVQTETDRCLVSVTDLDTDTISPQEDESQSEERKAYDSNPSTQVRSNRLKQKVSRLKRKCTQISKKDSRSDTDTFSISSHSKAGKQVFRRSLMATTDGLSDSRSTNIISSRGKSDSDDAGLEDSKACVSDGSHCTSEDDSVNVSLDQGTEDLEHYNNNISKGGPVFIQKRKRKNKPGKLMMENDVKCCYCNSTFNNRLDYFNHRQAKGGHFECKICGKVKCFESLLFVHMLIHEPHKGFVSLKKGSKKTRGEMKCNICDTVVSSLDTLKVHMNKHTGEKPYQCCVCGEDQQFVSLSALTHHLRLHKTSKRFLCKSCDLRFSSRGELSKHILTHEIKCGLCEEVFPNKTSRTCHYRVSHPHDIKKCIECSLLFSTDEELKKHARYHKRVKKEKCPECGMVVTRLKVHMAVHSKQYGAEEFSCDQCPRKFFKKANFDRHYLVHSGEKAYDCNKCSKKFSCAGRLRKHLLTHTLERPHVCEICGKQCSVYSNLKTHMRIHAETRRHPCSKCSQEFHHKASLDNHIKCKHKGFQESSADVAGSIQFFLKLEDEKLLPAHPAPFSLS